MPSSAAYEESVIEALMPRLEAVVARLTESGARLPDPDALAEAMAGALPSASTRSEYDRLLGPFYSSSGVMNLLKIPTKQALDDRRRRGTLLAARTSDGVWVYPSFQFDVPARGVLAALRPVLAAMKSAPRWGAALWLVTAHTDLKGRSPLQVLKTSDGHDVVRRLAAQYTQAITA